MTLHVSASLGPSPEVEPLVIQIDIVVELIQDIFLVDGATILPSNIGIHNSLTFNNSACNLTVCRGKCVCMWEGSSHTQQLSVWFMSRSQVASWEPVFREVVQ